MEDHLESKKDLPSIEIFPTLVLEDVKIESSKETKTSP
jgi:hypothetical protein